MEKINNPISDIIDDATFLTLEEAGLLNDTVVRNLIIKRDFKVLKRQLKSSTKAIDVICKREHRSFARIRDVIYNKSKLDVFIQNI